MADRKAIQLQDGVGNVYDIKDAEAREELSSVKSAISVLYDLNPVTTANSIDVTDYAGKTFPKVTSSINETTAISSVDLYCCGKNHLMLKQASGSSYGISWVNDPVTGSVTINGTATGKVNLFFGYNNSTFAKNLPVYNTKWRASITKSAQNDGVRVGFNGNSTNGDVYTYTASKNDYSNVASVCIASGTVCDSLVVYPMLEFGDYSQDILFEAFSGFMQSHTFDSPVTTVTIDWGAVEIPANVTTLWHYKTTNEITIYENTSKIDAIESEISDLDSRVDALEELPSKIDDAYAHIYEDYVSGWSDVTYYTTGYINGDGNVVEYGTNSYWYTDYIEAKEKDRVTYNLYGSQSKLVTFYNSSKEKISNISGAAGQFNKGSALAPEGTAYIRFGEQHGQPTGTFSIETWTTLTGDQTKELLKNYTDQTTLVTNTNIELTIGDVNVVENSIYKSTGIVAGFVNGRRTDYIPVSEGDTIEYRLWNYYGSPTYQYAVAAFDQNYALVDHVSGGDSGSGFVSGTYTVAEGTAYVMLSWNFDITKTGWFKINIATFSEKLLDYIARIQRVSGSVLKGKQWCCLGDSLTNGASTVNPYHMHISERTGVTAYNFGLSSTAITKDTPDITHNMATRYANMFDDVDYVTVFGGTNDHGRSLPIGQWGDATELTLYGAMKILCEGLINKYIGKKIGFLLPCPKCTTTNNVTTDYSYPSETFLPYIECIKDVCARYSIPVLDLYTQSDLHPSIANFRTAMMPDGLHPNTDGMVLLSYRIQSFLESL